jgi:clan AA aspartic protease
VGEIVVEIELENIEDRNLARAGVRAEADVRRETIRAVADTGAMMVVLPEDVVERLGVPVVDSIATTLADGSRADLPVTDTLRIRIGDREMGTECIVAPRGADALVGVLVMERLDLIADPVNQMLGPRPESPDRPLLRV